MTTTNPLDQLKDIHLPEAVSFWPPAVGWWLITVLFIILLISAFFIYKHWQKTAYRRQALHRINHLFDNNQTPHETASQLNHLLKTVAQQSYSTSMISRLTANQWLAFLDSSGNMQSFNQGPGQVLATAPYDQKSVINDPAELKRCCIKWVRRHK